MDTLASNPEEQLELLPLRHEPLVPVRASVYGESCYLAAWQRLLENTRRARDRAEAFVPAPVP